MRRFRNVTGAVSEQRTFGLHPSATILCFEFTALYAG